MNGGKVMFERDGMERHRQQGMAVSPFGSRQERSFQVVASGNGPRLTLLKRPDAFETDFHEAPHAEPVAPAFAEPEQQTPLFPSEPLPKGISQRSRTGWFAIAGLVAASAALPYLVPQALPLTYVAEARLQLVTGEGAVTHGLPETVLPVPETMLATASARIMAPENLRHAAERLGAAGEGFAASPTPLGIFFDILSGNAGHAEGEAASGSRLAQNVRISRAPDSYQIVVSASETDAVTGAGLTNVMADILAEELTAASVMAEPSALVAARKAVEAVEKELAGFKDGRDLSKLNEALRMQRELAGLGEEIRAADMRLRQAEDMAGNAAALKLADVLAKPLPADMPAYELEDARRRYVAAKLSFDQLSAALGPLHPRLIAAKSAADDARSTLQSALRSFASSMKLEEEAASAELSALKAQEAKLRTAIGALGSDAQTLQALESSLAKARETYLDQLQQAEEYGTTVRRHARVAVPASPETVTVSEPSRWFFSSVCGLAGLLLGGAGWMLARLFRREESIALAAGPDDVPVEADPPYEEPDFTDAVDDDLAQQRLEQPFDAPCHDQPANDMPLTEHIRQVLMRNRLPAAAAMEDLPPLMGAAIEGRYDRSGRDDATRELRRELAELRERVQSYANRRVG